jgi:hypothetical protein
VKTIDFLRHVGYYLQYKEGVGIVSRTTFLYATPSFLLGMAAVLDMGATLTVYNESRSPEEADFKAIYSDWVATGDDISSALNKWGNMIEQKG